MMRQRKPRIDLIGYTNDNGTVVRTDAPSKWAIKCNVCGKEHIQSAREIKRNHRSRNCEAFKPYNWSGLEREDAIMRRQYGISMEQFNLLLSMQNGGCAICGKSIDLLRRRMNVDHCHETKKVRGILCTGCNTGLGHLGDSVEGLNRAVEYLKSPPAAKLP